MATFEVSVPHRMGCQAALARVRPFLDKMQQTYAQHVSHVRRHWHDNRVEFLIGVRGYRIEGTLVVEDNQVHVSGPLQIATLFYRSRIEETIRLELEKLFRSST